MNIILFVLILGILVLVHELGHFLAAKRNGVKVEEFGIGFPPRLFSVKRGETIYSINLIPLGGFVKVYGEEYSQKVDKLERQKAFVYKKPHQKAAIIIAGVLFNFLLGWVIISYLFTQGVPTPINKVLIEKVQENSPAEAAGLKSGDYILKIKKDNSEYEVKSSQDLMKLTKKFAGTDIQVFVERGKEKVSLSITPRKTVKENEGPLGILITSFTEKRYPWYQAPFFGIVEAAKITQRIIVEIFRVLFQVVTFQKPQIDVAGPIGIASYASQAIKFGRNAVLELLALLSLNLAVINILPFPALDGGRLVFIVYEWISRRRINPKVERYLNLAGIILLLSLAALVSINDIIKLYR